jgi:hypothetical protein
MLSASVNSNFCYASIGATWVQYGSEVVVVVVISCAVDTRKMWTIRSTDRTLLMVGKERSIMDY